MEKYAPQTIFLELSMKLKKVFFLSTCTLFSFFCGITITTPLAAAERIDTCKEIRRFLKNADRVPAHRANALRLISETGPILFSLEEIQKLEISDLTKITKTLEKIFAVFYPTVDQDELADHSLHMLSTLYGDGIFSDYKEPFKGYPDDFIREHSDGFKRAFPNWGRRYRLYERAENPSYRSDEE